MRRKKPYVIKSRYRDAEDSPTIFANFVFGNDEEDALRYFEKTHPRHLPVAPPEHATWAD